MASGPPTVPQIPGNVLLVSGAVTVALLVPSPMASTAPGAGPGRRQPWASSRWRSRSPRPPSATWRCPSGWCRRGRRCSTPWPAGGPGGRDVGGVDHDLLIKVVSQTCWLVYAVVTMQTPVVISATVALTTALALVAVETLAPADRVPAFLDRGRAQRRMSPGRAPAPAEGSKGREQREHACSRRDGQLRAGSGAGQAGHREAHRAVLEERPLRLRAGQAERGPTWAGPGVAFEPDVQDAVPAALRGRGRSGPSPPPATPGRG